MNMFTHLRLVVLTRSYSCRWILSTSSSSSTLLTYLSLDLLCLLHFANRSATDHHQDHYIKIIIKIIMIMIIIIIVTCNTLPTVRCSLELLLPRVLLLVQELLAEIIK